MPLFTRAPRYLLTGFLSSALLTAGIMHAQSRVEVPGYVTDSEGNIVRSGTGECVHTRDWTPEMASVIGCDSVTLDAQVEIVEGAPSGIDSAFVIPAAALFAFDSAEFTEEGKAAIEDYRRQIRPELSSAYAGIIIGHTDSTGNPKYNMDLSVHRAEAVRNYLVQTGAPADKLRGPDLGPAVFFPVGFRRHP